MTTETVFELLFWAAIIWAAWRLGQLSVLIPLHRALESKAQEQGLTLEEMLDQDPEQSPAKDEMLLEIEKLGERYYVYKKDGDFLAQGSSFEELFTDLKQRFPRQSFRLPSMPDNLTSEETGLMTETIFRVFGDKK